MPDRAADPAPADSCPGTPRRAAGFLAWAAGAACVACCALPALIAAGLLGGAAAGLAAWLPAAAIVLAIAAAAVFTLGHPRARPRQPAHGRTPTTCLCAAPGTPVDIDLPTPHPPSAHRTDSTT
ncbi:hypothetical protein LO772_34495 [Yinghuangia sp. ASG 101]|uniref:hypothetical protein n=1 Tax=Yinghuangia sp. ASG 101 TaxID=2896848 RepID=UPI001E589854|nr:hypothetical protein [Yinghuangia sp. ASG 101]UGQ11821.1 hypothetical protein LO772_34495 [Yinghuangia sp. ASG 101]